MKLILVKQGSTELKYIWDWISSHPINEGIENPSLAFNNGIVWEYMGTFEDKGKYLHQVRHKSHPITQSVISYSFNSSDTFTSEQIEKSFKL